MSKKKGGNQENPTNVDDLNTFINKLFSEIIESNGMQPGPGSVYRFDVSVNQDGVTITPSSNGQVQSVKLEVKEPLVDVIERKEGISVVADLSGILKKDLQVHADHERLSIKAEAGKNGYSKLVPLPAKVDPTTAVATYNHGVLEVTFKRSNTYSSIVKIDLR